MRSNPDAFGYIHTLCTDISLFLPVHKETASFFYMGGGGGVGAILVSTNHLYRIYTTSAQRRRRWADGV